MNYKKLLLIAKINKYFLHIVLSYTKSVVYNYFISMQPFDTINRLVVGF